MDVHRLRNIAANLLAQWSEQLRPEIDDLVSAGWLGYRAAEEREPFALYPSFYYSCARFAMLEEIRKWAGATTRIRPRFVPFDAMRYDRPSTDDPTLAALWRESYAIACAAIDRHAEPAHARVIKAMVLDGEPIEIAATRLGISKRTVANYKAQGLRALSRALAA